MTQVIHADAMQSADNAKQITKIDEDLSEIVRGMILALNGGMHAISNEELINNLQKAKEAHGNWMKNLRRIVEEMHVYPIQTDSKRCAFGHFYHSLSIAHPDIVQEWTAIDSVHHEMHGMGIEVVEAVRKGEREQAQALCGKAEKLSQEVFIRIEKTIQAIEKNSRQGIEVLKV